MGPLWFMCHLVMLSTFFGAIPSWLFSQLTTPNKQQNTLNLFALFDLFTAVSARFGIHALSRYSHWLKLDMLNCRALVVTLDNVVYWVTFPVNTLFGSRRTALTEAVVNIHHNILIAAVGHADGKH